MIRLGLTAFLVIGSLAASPAEARFVRSPEFVQRLDHNGDLSAGWIQVLPQLASACNFKLDNQELTNKLLDLSRENGNLFYTRDLYTTLYRLETHQAHNTFNRAWSARFDGRQKEACDTAEALWGEAGDQFPGVLKREAMNDGVGVIPPGAAPTNCK